MDSDLGIFYRAARAEHADIRARMNYLKACVRAHHPVDVSILQPCDILGPDELQSADPKTAPWNHYDFFGRCETSMIIEHLVRASQEIGTWARMMRSPVGIQYYVTELLHAGAVTMCNDTHYTISAHTLQRLARIHLRP